MQPNTSSQCCQLCKDAACSNASKPVDATCTACATDNQPLPPESLLQDIRAHGMNQYTASHTALFNMYHTALSNMYHNSQSSDCVQAKASNAQTPAPLLLKTRMLPHPSREVGELQLSPVAAVWLPTAQTVRLVCPCVCVRETAATWSSCSQRQQGQAIG